MSINTNVVTKNLNSLIRNSNVQQKTICTECGFSRQSLYKWLLGTSIPSKKNLEIIANYFNVSIEDLLTEQVQNNFVSNSLIPLINGVDHNGSYIYTEAFTEPFVHAANLSVEADLCYKMPDMSMQNIRILKNDIVMISTTKDLRNGDVVLVNINNNLYLRIYIFTDEYTIFKCANQSFEYHDLVIQNNNFEIIGRATAFRSIL